MKAKNIFKTLAFAMLMPAILLTTACSNINNNEEPVKKGFTLPVTVNVTRLGEDATTKATYNESTRKLSFSEGDKLFVNGVDRHEGGAGKFAGTLDYVPASGKFGGTITTENKYTGPANDLFSAANETFDAHAILLPSGYNNSYGFFYIDGTGYEAELNLNYDNAFATSTTEKTAKALAVEQFSYEISDTYSCGFDLQPQNAILNFTINGLSTSTNVQVLLNNKSEGRDDKIGGSVTTDASGNASFAVGVANNSSLNKLSLTVGGNAIVLLTNGSNFLEPQKIYNITRSVPSLADAFVNGNTTSIAFGTSLTLSATCNNGSFGTVTRGGTMFNEVNASMERDGNDLKIGVTIMRVKADIHGDMTIDTVNNTYRWSNNEVGDMLTLSSITIGGNNITPLPTPSS